MRPLQTWTNVLRIMEVAVHTLIVSTHLVATNAPVLRDIMGTASTVQVVRLHQLLAFHFVLFVNVWCTNTDANTITIFKPRRPTEAILKFGYTLL